MKAFFYFRIIQYIMSYKTWFDAHAEKHKNIVDKLVGKNYTKEQIIDYFDFENMIKEENDFCPLYKDNKKCHDMEKLNCYLCACPNFRFDDNGLQIKDNKTLMSKCDIDNGEEYIGDEVIHQNCAPCSVPHHKDYVLKHFSLNWKDIMKNCPVK